MITVRVSEIRQYTFCPRVIWHRVAMGQPTRETPKMTMGRDTEAALERLEKRRALRKYGLERASRRFGVFLESDRLGLRGVCDLVLDTGDSPPRALPVEVKTTRGGVGRHHVLQLAAYAMLLEEGGHAPIEHGFVLVLPADSVHRVPIRDVERDEVLRVASEIREMLSAQRFPGPTMHRSFCEDCEYVNFCGDVL